MVVLACWLGVGLCWQWEESKATSSGQDAGTGDAEQTDWRWHQLVGGAGAGAGRSPGNGSPCGVQMGLKGTVQYFVIITAEVQRRVQPKKDQDDKCDGGLNE